VNPHHYSLTTTAYDEYLRSEWKLFVEDPRRAQISREALSTKSLSRVLDVGGGAGQELLPFAATALCIGVDLSPRVSCIGRELFDELTNDTQVAFARAAAEALPFQTNSFDAVICRLALPYTDNAKTLAEIARVLRPNGALLLKIHHARYYLRKFWTALFTRDFLSMVHASRVLLAGPLYHLTGKQVRIRLVSPETFQTKWLLRRELDRCGMVISAQVADSNPDTPAFILRNNK
jgi:SAM-dependent methyltransferase